MKSIKISGEAVKNISNQPLVAVIGAEPYRTKLMTDLLSKKMFYSKKFGRIIYIGEKKYKSSEIIQDETNWMENASYEVLMDFLDEAKKDEIVNLLFVFNTKDLTAYIDIIEKLIGIRFTYLKGLIGILIAIPTPQHLKKNLLSQFSNVFYVDTEHFNELKELFDVKLSCPEKRKKDTFVFGKKTLEVYKDIKD